MKINQTAFTLLEIIFASLIFGVIVLGVVTSNIALQKNSKNSSDAYYTIQNTSVSLNKILRDALLMVGTPSAPGYAGAVDVGGVIKPVDIGKDFQGNSLYSVLTSDPNTFCFYKWSNPYINSIGALGDPIPVINTPWVCYTLDNNNVYRCNENATGNSPALLACANGELVGHAKKLTPSFSLDNTDNGQKSIFSITIENCPDPSDARCGPGNNYPYIKKSGSVSPAAQSAG